jgi:hypothetical protein
MSEQFDLSSNIDDLSKHYNWTIREKQRVEQLVQDECKKLMTKNIPRDWYDGENLKSSVNYYATDKEVNDKIEFIRFMGHTGKYEGDPVQMSLYIRFKDGTDKWFLCEQNEDGSWDKDIFTKTLAIADEYLSTLQNESLVV